MNKIITHLKASETVLLTTHESPDGDALGSLLAMGLALQRIGKTVVLFNQSPIPAVYRFLPGVEQVIDTVDDVTRFDTAVVLDCGDIGRIGPTAGRIGRIPMVINIDHHITNTGFGGCRLIDVEACSSSEIVYEVLKGLGVDIDRRMATAIYTGILTDTGSFRFANTNSRAFAICAEMATLGVDPYYVAKHVYGTYSLGRIKLLNMALDSIEISNNGKLSLMTLTRKMFEDTDTQPEDVDGIINYAKRIEDVKVAAMIVEHTNGEKAPETGVPRRYHVSLRSDGSVDVAAIASAHGGGGHPNAAGFGIRSTLAELRGKIHHLADAIQ
jgi:phosphoesterase RecJ-like protein